MDGRTPENAYRAYLDPVADALSCVTHKRITRHDRRTTAPNVTYVLSLADMDPVPLKGTWAMTLRIGQRVRIDPVDRNARRAPFATRLIEYIYSFATPAGREVLGFHWTPGAAAPNAVTFPHLHIGRGLTAGQTAVRPPDFHKAHIPTGRITIAAIVRLAIVEFGVFPLRPDWERVLERAEAIAAG